MSMHKTDITKAVRYAVAVDNLKGEYKMYHGPFETVQEALEIDGMLNGRILKLSGTGNQDDQTVIYRWIAGHWMPEK